MAFMINDIDSPHHGLVHVVRKDLASVFESLK
jgi:hypothetical protein